MLRKHPILSLVLLSALLLASCAPEAAPTPVLAGETPAVSPPQAEPLPATMATSTEALPPAPPAAQPTSRGPDLVATDPTTVNLQSGKPTLLEFFAFW